jgi:hypothetical protein
MGRNVQKKYLVQVLPDTKKNVSRTAAVIFVDLECGSILHDREGQPNPMASPYLISYSKLQRKYCIHFPV